ncbi:MAG TPA: hypothetical protein VF177_22430 [Anaerolineae bacterium]
MCIKKPMPLLILFVLVLAGCSNEPSGQYTLGDVSLTEGFTQVDAWEQYADPDTGTDLQVADGAYRMQTGDNGYIWGLNEQEHNDIVIEVTASPASSHLNNAYGVMCRADTSNNGDGYYFLISGDGFYSIARGEGDDITPLVEWQESSAINEGQASNELRAICVGDYLALYINDKFLAETRDSAYGSGYAGFAAAAFAEGSIDVSFDDLTVWEASLLSTP